jgi:putative Holliday junction resolvase
MGRVLALDYGEKRIGVALSDPGRVIASPLEVYSRVSRARDAEHLQQLVVEYGIEQVVVGLPLHASGAESEKSAEARRFGDWVADATGLPVDFFDERYTSVEAEEHLKTARVTFRRRRSKRDMLAAQIFLQAYLDAGRDRRATS